MKAATGKLKGQSLEWSEDSAVTVVLASQGYPANPVLGEPIMGISAVEGASVFHAGTSLRDGILHSSGGRVLAVTGIGSDLTEARNTAYRVISAITLRGSHFRHDIALNASVAEKGN